MQQNVNLNLILDQVAKDKGIDRARLIEILEEAIGSAAKRHFGMERNLKARYDEDKGQVDLFQVLTIVDGSDRGDPDRRSGEHDPGVGRAREGHRGGAGDELDFPIYYRAEDEAEARAQDEQWGDLLKLKTYRRSFGRIAAQTAKQVMIQGTRNAERENVFNEYKDRKGEIITGIVRRFERGNVIVDLGRAEAVLPVREQVPRETYRAGDRIQAYVMDVLRESKGPQIILSRASVDLLKQLFEMEVPEIAEGIVVIEAAAREPGGRAKIAVSSRDSDVDPGRRLRGHEGQPRPGGGAGAPRREDRHRALGRGLRALRVQRARAGRGLARAHRRGRTRRWRSSSPTTSSRSPSAAAARTCGSRRSSPAGSSTSTRVAREGDARVRDGELRRDWNPRGDAGDALRPRLPQGAGRRQRRPRDADAVPRLHDGHDPGPAEAGPRAVDRGRREGDAPRAGARGRPHRRGAASPRRAHAGGALARVRGVGEKTIDQLKGAGYGTVEAVHNEADVMRLAESSGLGIKKARQIKHAVGVYLEEEAKLRAELDAQRAKAAHGGAGA